MRNVRNAGLALALVLALAAVGCKKGGGAFPGTEAGAKQLLSQFLKSGADLAGLTKSLRPESGDYAAVFDASVASRIKKAYEGAWDKGAMRIGAKPGQTELLLWSATTEDLKAGTGNASRFPGGYRRVAPHLKPGLRLYRFKFVRPGKRLGMAYDGLIHINGHWAIFPKPWRALR